MNVSVISSFILEATFWCWQKLFFKLTLILDWRFPLAWFIAHRTSKNIINFYLTHSLNCFSWHYTIPDISFTHFFACIYIRQCLTFETLQCPMCKFNALFLGFTLSVSVHWNIYTKNGKWPSDFMILKHSN